jgi:hypothetical protein
MNKIEEAIATLKEAGYYVDKLWSINDVEGDFTDETKRKILNEAMDVHTTNIVEENLYYIIKFWKDDN